MFGKAMLVSPLTEPKVNKWNVYLPKSESWYDFWTGKQFEGGQTINTDAPHDKIPLFVKAGSIIPIGPAIQYATEKNDPIEIRIYPGADEEFTLYEDENDNYDYEKGVYSTITFKWDDAKKELTINDRKGFFLGMLNKRKFCILKVSGKKVTGIDTVKNYDKIITYNGKKVVVNLF
jgi:alpha-D-xyloside xylohydrolase